MPANYPRRFENLKTRVFIMDVNTFRAQVESRIPNQIIARAGHLVCFRLLVPSLNGNGNGRALLPAHG